LVVAGVAPDAVRAARSPRRLLRLRHSHRSGARPPPGGRRHRRERDHTRGVAPDPRDRGAAWPEATAAADTIATRGAARTADADEDVHPPPALRRAGGGIGILERLRRLGAGVAFRDEAAKLSTRLWVEEGEEAHERTLDFAECRGRDSNPHSPEGYPILSRARLTSFATPAG